MSNVKILVDNTKGVLNALSGRDLLPAARNGGLVVQNSARPAAPIDKGALRASIHVEDDEVTNTAAWVNVGSELIYARIQEFGGVIEPKNKKFLSWLSKDGSRIFAKRVHIPAQPYLRPAMDNNHEQIKNAVGATIKMIIERVTA